MRQKIVIRAIIMKNHRVLLLRRSGGRPSIDGKYELPGGSLHDHDQPVDSLERSIQVHAGLEPESYRLHDVVSFIDPDYDDLQYLFILYFVEIADDARVTLDSEYGHYSWFTFSEIDPGTVTNSTRVLLDLGGVNLVDGAGIRSANGKTTYANDDKKIAVAIHSDGGSRGNPGPTASAYVIENNKNEVIDQGGEYLGDYLTNDRAEYYGVLLGLRAAVRIGARVINFYSDSLMVIDQLNGMFHVKNVDTDIYDAIRKLLPRFDSVRFRHIHREYNRLADSLVNRILDENDPKKRNVYQNS